MNVNWLMLNIPIFRQDCSRNVFLILSWTKEGKRVQRKVKVWTTNFSCINKCWVSIVLTIFLFFRYFFLHFIIVAMFILHMLTPINKRHYKRFPKLPSSTASNHFWCFTVSLPGLRKSFCDFFVFFMSAWRIRQF